MEGTILGRLAKGLGLVGLVLLIFFFLFRDLIYKDFVPKTGLTPEHAYNVIVFAMTILMSVTLIGIIAALCTWRVEGPIPFSRILLIAFLSILAVGASAHYVPKSGIVPSPPLLQKTLKHGDVPARDGGGNVVATISDVALTLTHDPKANRTNATATYGFYNGSGTQKGDQTLIIDILAKDGSAIEQISSPLDRSRCIYNTPERRSFSKEVRNIVESAEAIKPTVSNVTGRQGPC